MPQCGLAPGFISIAGGELIRHFDSLRSVRLRVGALPQHPHNVLKYSLTWSTEGLINEYGNPCEAIVDGRTVEVRPLEGMEEIEIDGTLYEAFNTSGGLGSLAQSFGSSCESMDYKTIRYPGHCEQMRLLMNDLKLNQDRGTLKRILENAVPQTLQDVVIVYAAVTGMQNGELREENYVSKIYPQIIAGRLWSAIQVSTASGLCAVLDLVLTHPQRHARPGDPGIVPPARYPRQPLRPPSRRRRQQGHLGRRRGERGAGSSALACGLSRVPGTTSAPCCRISTCRRAQSAAAAATASRASIPVDGSLLGRVRASSAAGYDAGHEQCGGAARALGRVPAPQRGELVRQIGDELRRHKQRTRRNWWRSKTARSSPRGRAKCRR